MKTPLRIGIVVVAAVVLQVVLYAFYILNLNPNKTSRDRPTSERTRAELLSPNSSSRSEITNELIVFEKEDIQFDAPSGLEEDVLGDDTAASTTYSTVQKISRDISEHLNLSESNPRTTAYTRSVVHHSDLTCFAEGLEEDSSIAKEGCRCKPGWNGSACSIPEVVFQSDTPWKKTNLTLRSVPRRIVQAFPFNMEFEMLDMRFAEIGDVVDVFLILESNFTAYGTPKPLYLLDRFRSGMYRDFAHKTVHVFLDYFPEAARLDGWVIEALNRNFIGTRGLAKISGLLSTDLFVLTDADELPRREALQFLKWHDGYTEPVAIAFQSNRYGFFWKPSHEVAVVVTAACSMAMLKYVYRYEAYTLRSKEKHADLWNPDVKAYLKMDGRVAKWTLGTDRLVAGWHCSWCLDPERIRNKLLSAQNGDFPRWGDYPEKTDVGYIKSLIGRGMWFDERTAFDAVSVSAPKRVTDNPELFKFFVTNLYVNESTIRFPKGATSATGLGERLAKFDVRAESEPKRSIQLRRIYKHYAHQMLSKV